MKILCIIDSLEKYLRTYIILYEKILFRSMGLFITHLKIIKYL